MRIKSLLTATALSLALMACGSNSDTAATKGEPVAKVKAPAGKQWVDVVSKTADGGYLVGNPDAKIKLIEYQAVTCSHCAEFEETGYPELFGTYVSSGQVNVELRNFLLNPYDLPITILTRCSGPEAYLGLTQQFFKNQRPALDKLSKTDPSVFEAALKKSEGERYTALANAMGVVDFFKERGVSEEQAKKCLADPAASKELIAMTDKAVNELQVKGTPAFFLNGAQLETTAGTPVWTQVKAKLAEAGAR